MEESQAEQSKNFYLNSDLDYQAIKVGDRLNGELVLNIYHVSQRAIVYRNEEIINWASTGLIAEERHLISRLEFLLEKARDKFKGVNRDKINRYKVRVLTTVFSGGDEVDAIESRANYLLGELEKYIDGADEVSRVVDRTGDFVVWVDKDGEVAYEIKEGKKFDDNIFIELSELSALGRLTLEDSQRKLFVLKLASSLAGALRKNCMEVGESFESAKRYLLKTVEVQAGSRLIYSVIAFSSLLLCVFVFIYFKTVASGSNSLRLLLLGAGGGLLGAVISVLQRSKDITVVPFESLHLIVLQGVVRVGLGCCFGVIAVLACNAGVFFDLLNNDGKRLLLLAIAAGVSERLIPDFIEKMSDEKGRAGGG